MENNLLIPDATQEQTPTPTPVHTMEIIEDDAFSYSGYQVVRGEFFAHIYEPSITFNQYKVSVNKACIRKLPDVDYVQILVNPDEKKLVVRPCMEDERDSFLWRTVEKKNPKQITCKVFFAKVIQLMGWNPEYRYKLLGRLIHSNGEYLFTFDLRSPEIYKRIILDGNQIRVSRIPMYPAEWENQFGLLVEEHRKALQINIVDGYAVFHIADSNRPSSEKTASVQEAIRKAENLEPETTG